MATILTTFKSVGLGGKKLWNHRKLHFKNKSFSLIHRQVEKKKGSSHSQHWHVELCPTRPISYNDNLTGMRMTNTTSGFVHSFSIVWCNMLTHKVRKWVLDENKR